MNSTCSRRLPITFYHNNKKHKGYMEPSTNIIYHQPGPPVDCEMLEEIPITLHDKSYLYQQKNGNLKPITKFTMLKSFLHNWTISTLPEIIFHPIIMYHLDEFRTHTSLNDLLGSLGRQQEVLNILGIQSQYNSPQESAELASANIVTTRIFSFITGLNLDFKQIWIFLYCHTYFSLIEVVFTKLLEKHHSSSIWDVILLYPSI